MGLWESAELNPPQYDRRSQAPTEKTASFENNFAYNRANRMKTRKQARILAIDDESVVRQAIGAYLEDRGYSCLEAENGRVGLEVFRREKPDLILVDLRMPEVDGLEVLATVSQESPETPVIIVSGTGVVADAIEALHLGAWDYVLKPIKDMEVLLHAVEKTLERARLIEENRKYREHLESEVKSRTAEIEDSNRALRESEERLNRAQAVAHVGNWELDLATNRIWGSEEAFRILGIPRMESTLSLEKVQQIFHEQDRPRLKESLEKLVQGNSRYDEEFRIRRRDGESLRVIHSRASLVTDEAGHPVKVTGTFQDVSDRKRLEEQLRHSQKMESIGQLAGGVAHDFNNLLSAILGYADMALLQLHHDDPLYGMIEEVLKAGERAKGLTQHLLAFSRRQVLEMKVLNLNRVVSEMEKMLRRLIGENIEFVTRLDPNLRSVKADTSQVQQVLLNLVLNARDAMPDFGVLTIESGNVEVNDGFGSLHDGMRPGPYVMLSVSDTGHGMDGATMDRIFDPFFTTKGRDKGTGLGLSTVYGIVKQHGGSISVQSERGRGSTFKVFLPRVEGDPEEEDRAFGSLPGTRGTETILVVEDEESVRNLASRVLQNHGYQILRAKGGDEAFGIVARYGGPIHLLLTDVIMPQMNGKELYGLLAPSRPDMKVLYMSGHPDEVIAHHGILEEGTRLIQKPLSVQLLTRKVRETLDGID